MHSSTIQMTATLVGAHMSNNKMKPGEVKGFIIEVFETLKALDPSGSSDRPMTREEAREAGRERVRMERGEGVDATEGSLAAPEPTRQPAPASAARQVVPERDDEVDPRWPGVKRDRIVCLEDQVETVLLKPHLRRRYGMTAEQYRAKWDLPEDYPMAAPAYVERKRELALRDGLGSDRRPGGRVVAGTKRTAGTLKLGFGGGAEPPKPAAKKQARQTEKVDSRRVAAH